MSLKLSRRRAAFRPEPLLRRREKGIAHVAGLVLTVAGAGMILSAAVDVLYGGPDTRALLTSAATVMLPGLLLWGSTRPADKLPTASIYSVVLMSWVALSVAGTIPYLMTGAIVRFDEALFESVAGFTTTGSSILTSVETLGPGIAFWRSMTQWFGGMGVIVLAVAVLPFLGVGGLSLMDAEAPGPSSERLVPRVRETARRLWILYVGLTMAVTAGYLVTGMGLFDAVNHSFTTVSTGGFSTHDRSLAGFGSPGVEWVAIGGMFLAGGSFALYWRAIRGDVLAFWRSQEARAYAAIVAASCMVAATWNSLENGFSHDVVRGSVFSVVAVITTTGYGTVDFALWVPPLQLLLLFGMGLGGMTGSTAGGFKVFRLLAVLAYARRQIVHQLHPRSVGVVRLGRDVISDQIVARTVGFFGLFMAAGAAATFVVAATGSDVITSISAAAASIGNIGPGLGDVGPTSNYTVIHPVGRMSLAALMLVGRLEIFPVLLGLVPLYRILDRKLGRRVGRR